MLVVTICNAVIDGNTFSTEGGSLIRLANVVVPQATEPSFEKPKKELEKLILEKTISFQEVSKSNSYIIANVWVDSIHVNNYMRELFPSEDK